MTTPPPTDPAEPSADGTPADDPAAGRVLVLTLLVGLAWNLVGNLVLPGAWYVPANLAVAALLLAIARWSGYDWPSLGVDRSTWRAGLRYGLLAMAVVALVLVVAQFLPPAEDALLDDGVRDDSTFDRWYVPLVRIPFGTAVYEEVVFRSVLLAAVTSLVGVRRSLVVTSVLFGLWHVVPAWEGAGDGFGAVVGAVVGAVALTTVAGLLFGWLRIRSGSVLAPILAHTATNSFAYAAALVAIERAG